MAIARRLDNQAVNIEEDDPNFRGGTIRGGEMGEGGGPSGDPLSEILGQIAPDGQSPFSSTQSPRERQPQSPRVPIDFSMFDTMANNTPAQPVAPSPVAAAPTPPTQEAGGEAPNMSSQLMSLISGSGAPTPAPAPSPIASPAGPTIGRAPQIMTERSAGLMGSGGGLLNGGLGAQSLAGGRSASTLNRTIRRIPR